MNTLNQIYVYPTDTVWGIGCNINSENGFLEIARIKKTTTDKPLSILFTDRSELNSYFQLPAEIDNKKLFALFEWELTILIPKEFLKINFPKYLLDRSEYISVRLIENSELQNLRAIIGAPFFTTSLNITSEKPITSEREAIDFKNKYCPNAHFITSSIQKKLSGISSTMIKINLTNKIEIVRSGQHTEKIKDHLLLLNLL